MKTLLAALLLTLPSAPAAAAEPAEGRLPSLLSVPQLEVLLANANAYETWCNGENVGCIRMTVESQASALRLFLPGDEPVHSLRNDPVLGEYVSSLARLDRCVYPTTNPFRPYRARKRACNAAVQRMIDGLQAAIQEAGGPEQGVAVPN